MRRSPRLRTVAVDVGLVALALLDAALSARVDQASRAALGASVLAALALAVRRRWPYATFALTLPGLLIASVLIAPLVALYTLAAASRNRRPVLVLAVRRRWPYATFALTLPGLLIASVLIAPLVALYTLAAASRNRRPVLV